MPESPRKKPVLSIDDIQKYAVELRMLGYGENQTWVGMVCFLNTFAIDRGCKTEKEEMKERAQLQCYADMTKAMFQLNLI